VVSRAPAAALIIDEGQRVALVGLAASQAAPHRQVQRAKALLLAADGVANSHIAQRIGVSVGTVRAWRDRFAEDGLAKYSQRLRRGLDEMLDRERASASRGPDEEEEVWIKKLSELEVQEERLLDLYL
jgi:transposase